MEDSTNRIITAAEMDELSMCERHRLAAEAIIADVSAIPPETLAWARAQGRRRLEALGVPLPPA